MKITPRISGSGITNAESAFEDFFRTLRPSLKLRDYFVNWDKVFRNTKTLEIHLNIWNYLIGKPDFDSAFIELLKQHPEIVYAIPTLIVRDGSNNQVFSIIDDLDDLSKPDLVFDFSKPASSDVDRELALKFFKETGLVRLFARDGVKNLVDYVIGVEAGLDSNGRKNRSGSSMEIIVESYLKLYCKSRGISYLPQATAGEIRAKWGMEVPVDKSNRRFDFAISDENKLVLMEVNFYGGGGSKLKATAGEYKGLSRFVSSRNIQFVWITDGEGWHTTREPLLEAYKEIDYVWNLDWLYRDYLDDIFQR